MNEIRSKYYTQQNRSANIIPMSFTHSLSKTSCEKRTQKSAVFIKTIFQIFLDLSSVRKQTKMIAITEKIEKIYFAKRGTVDCDDDNTARRSRWRKHISNEHLLIRDVDYIQPTQRVCALLRRRCGTYGVDTHTPNTLDVCCFRCSQPTDAYAVGGYGIDMGLCCRCCCCCRLLLALLNILQAPFMRHIGHFNDSYYHLRPSHGLLMHASGIPRANQAIFAFETWTNLLTPKHLGELPDYRFSSIFNGII